MRLICPACGNCDRTLMQHNGLPTHDPFFALLCMQYLRADERDDGTEGVCGNQWEPNDFPPSGYNDYPDDTPSLSNCDDWGTGEGRYHGRI